MLLPCSLSPSRLTESPRSAIIKLITRCAGWKSEGEKTMAVFKCKMCDANLEVLEGTAITRCEYCGTAQTVSFFDDRRAALYRRANQLRMQSEFDKAAGIFEAIIAENPQDAESYWGLCLCKYGIEYVDDPRTGRKIPTCHRTSYDHIQADANFNLAVGYAEPTIAEFYRQEAQRIDALQQSILSTARGAASYDVFICYKESDESGQRTKDSVLAQDIYDALTAQGYRVFFARVTLDDKLGQEYEPYIFSALQSAKVMLALGTRPEHFQAVWVRNEWSRFLHLMREDRSKVLIPCYCDMNPYEMPPEFKNIQGQDMGQIGFMQDLVHGLRKIIQPGAGRFSNPGYDYAGQYGGMPQQNPWNQAPAGFYGQPGSGYSTRKKWIAILLALVAGGFGGHDFYLGDYKIGVIKVIVSIISCGAISWVWSFIDFLLLVAGKKKTDAEGRLLR